MVVLLLVVPFLGSFTAHGQGEWVRVGSVGSPACSFMSTENKMKLDFELV